MSKGLEITLGVIGGLIVVGGIIYFVEKKKSTTVVSYTPAKKANVVSSFGNIKANLGASPLTQIAPATAAKANANPHSITL